MEDGESGTHWFVWLLVVAGSAAIGAMAARWVLGPRAAAGPAAPAAVSAPAAAPAPPVTAAAPEKDQSAFDLPGDERQGEPSIVWGNTAAASKEAPAQAAPAVPVTPAEAKRSRELGFIKNALSKTAEKLLDNPKALAALFNNDYVVKGFMSRDTVRSATASKAALAAYLGDPSNLSRFMAKPAVKRGLNSQELTATMASTKLVAALMDTPGGKALLEDQNAMSGVFAANPALATVLANPGVAAAMARNPRTAGVLGAARAR